MKQHWKVFASAAAALVWLWVSAALAVPWVRSASLHLPFAYVVFVVAGVALLPAYLMGAMFLSNLLHRRLPPRFHPGCRPVSVIVCARNEEKNIYRTIGSIAGQEYDGRMTILCVDNDSADGTVAEMRRAAADFSRPGRVIRLYGCCEPVDPIWDRCISTLKNLRKVSISPWCNEEIMSEKLRGTNIIYHRKPSPNFLGVGTTLDEDAFRQHIRKSLTLARGCKMEITQRDVYTINNDIAKARRYVQIIKQEIVNQSRPGGLLYNNR